LKDNRRGARKTSPLPRVPTVPPKRAYDRTVEETEAVVQEEVKQHFQKKVPEPKVSIPEKTVKHFVNLLNQPSQVEMSLDDNYTRTIKKQMIAKKSIAQSSRTKRDVPQLGLQAKQSIPDLKVLPENVPHDHVLGDVDPEIVAQVAKSMGMTVEDFLSDNIELPKAVVARQYVAGEPLVSEEDYMKLPTNMRNLHDWYMQASKGEQIYLVADVGKEYYFREESIHIEFTELFQLFHLRALDKSLISCYCL
jgi:hypothetical protein